jgi:hypothetical protein
MSRRDEGRPKAMQYLLGQFRRLHARLDNLQSNQMARRLVVALQTFGLEANGKAALAQLVGGSVVDAMRFRYNRWRRIRVDRHG